MSHKVDLSGSDGDGYLVVKSDISVLKAMPSIGRNKLRGTSEGQRSMRIDRARSPSPMDTSTLEELLVHYRPLGRYTISEGRELHDGGGVGCDGGKSDDAKGMGHRDSHLLDEIREWKPSISRFHFVRV
ncbi:hypothetical protein EVAR_73565_1 [Eumeta japonica]|uniref:Uncharacterized protein n=1 Tax=Eumeta variegata TaxID=151549 RepID=A0A4C1SQG2_EUMVA|nr:hypothetical protein EVAR_73565_1 [Eumeta japonica]